MRVLKGHTQSVTRTFCVKMRPGVNRSRGCRKRVRRERTLNQSRVEEKGWGDLFVHNGLVVDNWTLLLTKDKSDGKNWLFKGSIDLRLTR